MQTINLWHQLHLHRSKARKLVLLLLTFLLVGGVQAQNFSQINLPDYDNRLLHFGFTLGVHQSSYRLQYNSDFDSEFLDSLHSIQVRQRYGFSIGFLANFHVAQYLDLRPMFKVSFYEYLLDYNYTTRTDPIPKRNEAAYVELPLTFKYRSLRRRNFGMYLVGGVTPGVQVGGRPDDDTDPSVLHVYGENLSVEYGLGLDIY